MALNNPSYFTTSGLQANTFKMTNINFILTNIETAVPNVKVILIYGNSYAKPLRQKFQNFAICSIFEAQSLDCVVITIINVKSIQ